MKRIFWRLVDLAALLLSAFVLIGWAFRILIGMRWKGIAITALLVVAAGIALWRACVKAMRALGHRVPHVRVRNFRIYRRRKRE